VTGEYAAAAGVSGRVVYVEGGSPDELVRNSLGLVTVNSTMGILALTFGVPVVALGHAIYDMPGLTFQDGIDGFWRSAVAPDPLGFDAFRRVVAARTQVNGGFYSSSGLRLAVAGAAERLGRVIASVQPAASSEVVRQRSETAGAASPAFAADAWLGAEATSK
jgi:capsular polysaccharide export protein